MKQLLVFRILNWKSEQYISISVSDPLIDLGRSSKGKKKGNKHYLLKEAIPSLKEQGENKLHTASILFLAAVSSR